MIHTLPEPTLLPDSTLLPDTGEAGDSGVQQSSRLENLPTSPALFATPYSSPTPSTGAGSAESDGASSGNAYGRAPSVEPDQVLPESVAELMEAQQPQPLGVTVPLNAAATRESPACGRPRRVRVCLSHPHSPHPRRCPPATGRVPRRPRTRR